MTKAEHALQLMKQAIGTWIYVWGGKGEILSDMTDEKRKKWIEEHETADGDHTKSQNVERCEALYQKYVKAGVQEIRAGDCSGLISYVLMLIGIIKSRRNSRGLYADCIENTDKSGMTRKDLRPGDLVFKHNGKKIHHVAMYAGNNMIVEMTGRDIGAQQRKLSSKDNRFGRMKGMDDQPDPPEPTPPEPTPPVTDEAVKVIGGSVYIRKGPGKGYKTLLVAHRGNTFALRGQDPETGWYHILLKNGNDGWISNRPDLTEVIHNA